MGLVVGTAGHIDHGKTTLVRALTGMDTDRLREEKKRGLSIDLGFAHMELDDGKLLSFVDVPGHERFIRNMLAGVGGIDCVLFCVACDDGIMPQTIEHLEIVNTLGIERGVFVLTKADTVEEGRIEEVRKGVQQLAEGTTLEGSPVVAVSAHTGRGLEELTAELKRLYRERSARTEERWTRLPIDRVFPVKGFGCVVTGTLVEGNIKRGDTLTVFPNGREVKVRGLQSHHRELSVAEPHSRVAVNLSGISHRECRRGEMLVDDSLYEWLKEATIFDCIIDVSRFAERPLKNNSHLKLYCFTTEATVRVRLIDREELASGMRAAARVFSKIRLPLLGGDRFILRDPSAGRTIGGGRIVVTYPSKRLLTPIRDVDVSSLERRDVVAITRFLLKRRAEGIGVDTLCFMLNVEEEEIVSLSEEAGFELAGGRIIGKDKLVALKDRVLSLLGEYHRRHPERRGIHRGELTDRAEVPEALRDVLLERLIEEGKLKAEGALVRLSTHRAVLKGRDMEIARWLMSTLKDGTGAIRGDVLTGGPYRREDVERVLRYLTDSGELVKLKEGLYIARETIDMAMDRLKCYIKEKGSIRAGQFRDILGCGRRLAIDILEYFDRRGVTVRDGDVRRLLNP